MKLLKAIDRWLDTWSWSQALTIILVVLVLGGLNLYMSAIK